MKSKINYKLLNFLLVLAIIYLIYHTRALWLGLLGTFYKIIIPFFIAFIIAYALSPLVRMLTNKKIPHSLAVTIVILGFGLLFGLVLWMITPVFIEQVGGIFNGIIAFFKDISIHYNIDFNVVQNQLSGTFNQTLEKLGTYVSNGAVSIIGMSVSIFSQFFIGFAALIYFLLDMDKIREATKKFAISKSKKLYNYLSLVNEELENYLSGFVKIVFISYFEYTILYLFIGHPDALMLGALAGVANLIPYFGGIITNIIAGITAIVISPWLFIKTCIVFIICSIVDGNVINPLVYGKTNKIHPLVVIISVFAGGIIGGILGIIISLPVAIVLISTYKYFKDDINQLSKKKLKA